MMKKQVGKVRPNILERQVKEKLSKRNRSLFAERIIDSVKRDKENKWRANRSIENIRKMFGVNIENEIRKKLGGKKKVSVLDIGSGKLTALTELKLAFGNTIEAHGLSLNSYKKSLMNEARESFFKRKNDPKRNVTDNLNNDQKFKTFMKSVREIREHKGVIEDYRFGQKFDFIYSFATMSYTLKHPIVIEKLCNILKRNGVAIIQYPSDRITSEMRKVMEKNGFRIRTAKNGSLGLEIIRIENKLGKQIKFDIRKRVNVNPKIRDKDLRLK